MNRRHRETWASMSVNRAGAGGIIDDEQTARGQQLRVVDAGVGFGDAGAGVGELVTDGSVGLLAGWAAPQNFAAGGGGSVVQAA